MKDDDYDEADRIFDGLIAPLFKFYNVSIVEDLIKAQSDHVERLQDRIDKLTKPASFLGGYRRG